MKTIAIISVLGICWMVGAPARAQADDIATTAAIEQRVTTITQPAVSPMRPISIFNGENLMGWRVVLRNPEADPAEVWSVKDGVIACTGKVNGYLCSLYSFKEYQFSVEWRWPETPGNSGVFVNVQGPDKVWPMAQEIQLRTGEVGDIRLNGGSDAVEKNQARPGKTHPNQVPRLVAGAGAENLEKPSGEWNQLIVKVTQGRVFAHVNGQMVNIVQGTVPDEGYIALQSEGSPIEFRNLIIGPPGQ